MLPSRKPKLSTSNSKQMQRLVGNAHAFDKIRDANTLNILNEGSIPEYIMETGGDYNLNDDIDSDTEF